MKILLVEPQTDLRELICLKINMEFGAEVSAVSSASEAITLLRSPQDFDCIVSEHLTPNGTGADIVRYLTSCSSKAAFILCSSLEPSCDAAYCAPRLYAYAPKPGVLVPLQGAIRELLLRGGASTSEDSYCRVSTKTLLKFRMFSCDLFVRLPEGRFVKIFSARDLFEPEDFDRFSIKNVDTLYVNRKDGGVFLERAIESLSRAATLPRPLPMDPLLRVSTETLELVQEFNDSLGFTLEVRELTLRSIQLALSAIREKPEIARLLDQLTVDPEHYVASHSVALIHLSCGIASLLEWGSEETFFKLAVASFLHDLTLRDPALARIQTHQGMSAHQIRPSDPAYREIMDHPNHAAALLDEMEGVPIEVGTIIRQHHERPLGDGFPKKLICSQIAPLSCVFILSHELLMNLEGARSQGLAEALGKLYPIYDTGHFRKFLNSISAALAKTNADARL